MRGRGLLKSRLSCCLILAGPGTFTALGDFRGEGAAVRIRSWATEARTGCERCGGRCGLWLGFIGEAGGTTLLRCGVVWCGVVVQQWAAAGGCPQPFFSERVDSFAH